MSKAFTKDDAATEEIVVPARPPLPDGVPNYVTPRGLLALRAELARFAEERQKLSTTHEPGAVMGELEAIANRMAQLDARIVGAKVVDPALQPHGEARFGARVTVRGEDGSVRTYQIVGVDEADAGKGLLAFTAPLARALLGKRAGEAATLRTPRGEEELEIVSITYEEGPAASR